MFTLANFDVKEIIPAAAFGHDYVDWGLKAVGAEVAWSKTKGRGIKIAVLDSGTDPTHPDLAPNTKEYIDFTKSPHGIQDMVGHGVHVCGIIAGAENGIGMMGVAPEAELYVAKVLGDNGNGSYETIMKGIQWAMTKEVDIISMSLGIASRPPEKLHRLIQQAVAQGIILVAATGNENGDVCYPAAYDEVIAVSATNQAYERATFSNYGIQNEISAPGVDIVSTYKNGGYARLSGTSMATPLVAGAIALIIARHQDLFFGLKPSVGKTHQILTKMVKDLGKEGKDEYYGAGMLNLAMLP